MPQILQGSVQEYMLFFLYELIKKTPLLSALAFAITLSLSLSGKKNFHASVSLLKVFLFDLVLKRDKLH